MTIQPANRVPSAPTEFRLPQMEWTTDRAILARPHRRLATAKLRREWLLHKYGSDPYRPHISTQLQRSKTFTSTTEKKPDKHPPTKCYEPVAGANNVWQNDILSRKLPERIPIVRPIRIHTAPPRTIITDTQRDSAPFFQGVPSTAKKTEQEKERGRMHFINREWPSEKVSWVRFYRNVPERFRRSWME